MAFDNPWPPDYGGAIDVFYKIKALHDEGARIHLHLFAYGRYDTGPLRELTESLTVYPRRRNPLYWLSPQPYIVRSRRRKRLEKRLRDGALPVWMEGIHTTAALPRLLPGQLKMIRIHNIEHAYYAYLARHEKHPLRRLYYRSESAKLRRYEPAVWPLADLNFSVSARDRQTVGAVAPAEVLPVFHPFTDVRIPPASTTPFVLFHGNLSVIENSRAAVFLWQKVVRPLGLHMVVAGKNPPETLRRLARQNPRLGLVANPGADQMERLIRTAEVHLIYSDNLAGFKLKLLYALFRGRQVLASRALVEDSPVAGAVETAETPQEWRERLRLMMQTPWDEIKALQTRRRLLNDYFDNRQNARQILEYVR